MAARERTSSCRYHRLPSNSVNMLLISSNSLCASSSRRADTRVADLAPVLEQLRSEAPAVWGLWRRP
jgi:hypothetical protein